jgi:hypothetical protein
MNPAVKRRAAVWAAWATCVLVAALTVAAILVNFLPGQSPALSLRCGHHPLHGEAGAGSAGGVETPAGLKGWRLLRFQGGLGDLPSP